MPYLAGHSKRAIIRDLAAGELTDVELSEKYDVTIPWLRTFTGKYMEQIFAIRNDPTDELSHLWIAKMVDRLAEIETDVEFINTTFLDGVPPSADLLRAKLAMLKHAAEMLGQLMPKMQGDGMLKHVTYTIEGVDPNLIWGPNPNPPQVDDGGEQDDDNESVS